MTNKLRTSWASERATSDNRAKCSVLGFSPPSLLGCKRWEKTKGEETEEERGDLRFIVECLAVQRSQMSVMCFNFRFERMKIGWHGGIFSFKQ